MLLFTGGTPAPLQNPSRSAPKIPWYRRWEVRTIRKSGKPKAEAPAKELAMKFKPCQVSRAAALQLSAGATLLFTPGRRMNSTLYKLGLAICFLILLAGDAANAGRLRLSHNEIGQRLG